MNAFTYVFTWSASPWATGTYQVKLQFFDYYFTRIVTEDHLRWAIREMEYEMLHRAASILFEELKKLQ